ncbi:MAG: succinate dehydrogenase assembly factor 2 [Pseudomonadota bacterium]
MDARRRKLQFRASRRGFKEMDLLMGAFADQHIAALDDDQLDAFERLLDAPDQDVYSWITAQAAAPDEYQTSVLDLLKSFRYFARANWSDGQRA